MKIIKTPLEGAFIIEPSLKKDARGYFFESFNERDFKKTTGLEIHFVQDNQAESCKGVLRGLHYQKDPEPQAKLVSVINGSIRDVIVDMRPNSATYLKWFAIEINEQNKYQIFIPHGFAHGYTILSDIALVQYKCDNYYNPLLESGIRYYDPAIDVDWAVDLANAIISEKDQNWPFIFDQ